MEIKLISYRTLGTRKLKFEYSTVYFILMGGNHLKAIVYKILMSWRASILDTRFTDAGFFNTFVDFHCMTLTDYIFRNYKLFVIIYRVIKE